VVNIATVDLEDVRMYRNAMRSRNELVSIINCHFYMTVKFLLSYNVIVLSSVCRCNWFCMWTL